MFEIIKFLEYDHLDKYNEQWNNYRWEIIYTWSLA